MTAFIWIAFIVLVLVMLALDLGVFHRKSHVIGVREALGWTAFWVTLALGFNVGVYFIYENHFLGIGSAADLGGRKAAMQFLAGFLIEKSLSLDNIFVIALIFSYFGVPAVHQHRVLFWGIIGALLMRGVMIAAGAALIHRFDWIVYVFGAFLIVTAVRLMFASHAEVHPDRNPLVRLARRMYPVSTHFEGERFFTRIDGKRAITPMFLVLIVIESTDLMFAVDSIPAIFAVTLDPFIVFTSNVFAILGLRSLYFALAGVMRRFRYLNVSLMLVLMFVGVKMILVHHYPIPTGISLGVISVVLAGGILASIIQDRRRPESLVISLKEEVVDWTGYTLKQGWRLIILIVGTTLLLIGLMMIVLPGPATLLIPLGLAVLATEFVWARNILKKIKAGGANLAGAVFGKRGNAKGADREADKSGGAEGSDGPAG